MRRAGGLRSAGFAINQPRFEPQVGHWRFALGLSFSTSNTGTIHTYVQGRVGRMKEATWEGLTQNTCSEIVQSTHSFHKCLLTIGYVPASVPGPGVTMVKEPATFLELLI